MYNYKPWPIIFCTFNLSPNLQTLVYPLFMDAGYLCTVYYPIFSESLLNTDTHIIWISTLLQLFLGVSRSHIPLALLE